MFVLSESNDGSKPAYALVRDGYARPIKPSDLDVSLNKQNYASGGSFTGDTIPGRSGQSNDTKCLILYRQSSNGHSVVAH